MLRPTTLVRRVRRAVRRYGLAGALRKAAHRIRRIPARRRYLRVEREFDARYGVDTANVAHLDDLDIASPNKEFGNPYEAVHPDRFREIVGSLPIDYERFTFVDLGSGKGRALILAAEYPFHRVIGVEFSRELHDVAQRNLANVRSGARKCDQVESICTDAARFDFPPEPLVVYFLNPFEAPVMNKVLERISASVEAFPREVLLVFTGDVPQALQTQRGGFTRLADMDEHRRTTSLTESIAQQVYVTAPVSAQRPTGSGSSTS
jgi:SAM-dependent methyltransferase